MSQAGWKEVYRMAKHSRFIKEIQHMDRKEHWRRKPARNTAKPPPESQEEAPDAEKKEEAEEKKD